MRIGGWGLEGPEPYTGWKPALRRDAVALWWSGAWKALSLTLAGSQRSEEPGWAVTAIHPTTDDKIH